MNLKLYVFHVRIIKNVPPYEHDFKLQKFNRPTNTPRLPLYPVTIMHL